MPVAKKTKKEKEPSLVQQYLTYHETYIRKYDPERTLVLMQVGSFYETYATDERGPKVSEVANRINIVCTRRDKSMEISESNPYVMGFPLVSAQKYLTLLINQGFTLIMIDQIQTLDKENEKDIDRKVTTIHSPSTYLETIRDQDTNYTVCIVLEEEPQKSGLNLLCTGMSAVDLSTGKCCVHEALSTASDPNLALDEAVRFITSLDPKEIIVYYTPKRRGTPPEKFLSHLRVGDRRLLVKDVVDAKYQRLAFQNEFLRKVYKGTGMISPVEYLDLERVEYARLSFLLLLEFAHEHNERIIDHLLKPEQTKQNTHMILGNNAIYQLDIVEVASQKEMNGSKYKCLFDVVNNTSTALGRRYLKDRLISPLVDHTELARVYDNVEELLEGATYVTVENHLRGISDIERFERKMALNMLHPFELFALVESCREVVAVHRVLSGAKKLQSVSPSAEVIAGVEAFLARIEATFENPDLKKYSLNNIISSFFKDGIHEDLDKMKQDMKAGYDFMNELCQLLCEYIADTKLKGRNRNRNRNKEMITVRKNARDKYYLNLSKSRANALLENLQNVPSLKVAGKTLQVSDLKFDTSNKSVTKITVSGICDDADDLSGNEVQIGEMTRKYYLATLVELYAEFHAPLSEVIRFVAYLDYLKSNAKTAVLYNYRRPTLRYDSERSYIECRQLRHPIIERLIDYEYVPHDVRIGTDLKGMLIYGPNSSGKSSLMKALGLSLVMAQAGMFVPAREFCFSPYTSLYTRISGEDNLFKCLSFFAVEMLELKAILKRAGPRTLVIGDEVCRGTEHISGNALVASTIVTLAKQQTSFIFATHLHEMATMKWITDLATVKAFHISVEYDAKTDTLIYDRCLREGPGERIYGITFARYILQDDRFIEMAVAIKNDLLKDYGELVSGKTSRYNSGVFVHECQLCGRKDEKCHVSPLETHHIQFQKDCVDGFSTKKPHIKKNSPANLIILCNECHDKIHRDEIDVAGYTMTSGGKATVVNVKGRDGGEAKLFVTPGRTVDAVVRGGGAGAGAGAGSA